MAYQRWYDFDVRLSGVVRSMEFMSPRNQLYFGQKLLELSEQLLSQRGGTEYIEALHPKKKEGLDKSQAKKRWYDRDEKLHQAFNNLYALSSDDRREIASLLTTPVMIVEAYEKSCKRLDQEPDVRIVEEILRTCLMEGQERAKRLYAIYMTDFSESQNVGGGSCNQGTTEGFWSNMIKNLQEFMAPA